MLWLFVGVLKTLLDQKATFAMSEQYISQFGINPRDVKIQGGGRRLFNIGLSYSQWR